MSSRSKSRSSDSALPIAALVTQPYIFGAGDDYPEDFDLMLLRLDAGVLDRIFAASIAVQRHLHELQRKKLSSHRPQTGTPFGHDIPVDLPLTMHRSVVLEEFGWSPNELTDNWLALPAGFPCEALGNGDIGGEKGSMWTSLRLWAWNRTFGVRINTGSYGAGFPVFFEARLDLDSLRRLQRGGRWDGETLADEKAARRTQSSRIAAMRRPGGGKREDKAANRSAALPVQFHPRKHEDHGNFTPAGRGSAANHLLAHGGHEVNRIDLARTVPMI